MFISALCWCNLRSDLKWHHETKHLDPAFIFKIRLLHTKEICQLCSWTSLNTTGIQCHALGYNGDASSVAELLPLVSCLGIEPRYLTIHLPAVFILDSYFHYVLFGQGIHEPNGPTQEYFRLERLVDMVVSPYLSNYLYMSPSDSSSGAHSFYVVINLC